VGGVAALRRGRAGFNRGSSVVGEGRDELMRLRAVTLVEVILVILVIGLIIGFAFPKLDVALKGGSLTESADRLRSLILMSHAEAMQTGLKYRIQFPGTPDPNDPLAEKEIDVPFETLQPFVERQVAPIENREAFGGFDASWKDKPILQPGTRCVAVHPGMPRSDIRSDSEVAGISFNDLEAEFVPLVLNPDGRADAVTFVLTDLPPDTELAARHMSRIYDVAVDGRTGAVWMQRKFQVAEIEYMQELHVRPPMFQDFTRAEPLDEDDIYDRVWETHIGPEGKATVGRQRSRE